MRLKSLWIDGFKNLNNFKIDFEKRVGTTVLIGNNASGKSNVLEAISAIFARLYDDTLSQLAFKFDLIYTINEMDIRVSKKQKLIYRIKKQKLRTWNNLDKLDSEDYVAGVARAGPSYDFRPSQVIALYSGEESRLRRYYYQRFTQQYNKDIIDSKIVLESKQKMLYISRMHWDIALLTMLASDISLDDIIGSEKLSNIKLKFNLNNIRNFKTNEVTIFLRSLCNNENSIMVRLDEFKELIGYEVRNRLFGLLCVSYLTKDKLKIKSDRVISKGILIKNIGLIFSGDMTAYSFSEGQKKQILLKLILDVLADENSLILFDEPDAHIHIANKKLIPQMLEEYEGKREVVLTTHSPTLAYSFDNKHLAYIENGKINEQYNNQEKILSELTQGLMGVSEQQIFLQSNKHLILLVEGKTDKTHIETALDKLKNNYQNLDFDIFYFGGANSLKQFVQGFKSSEANDKQKSYIAIFDNDKEGRKKLKKTGTELSSDNKHQITKNMFGLYLPIEGAIEDMYPLEPQRKAYRQVIDNTDNFTDKKIKDSFKSQLASNCKNFGITDFENFKKLFNDILKIKKTS